jgi:hypothetical protein
LDHFCQEEFEKANSDIIWNEGENGTNFSPEMKYLPKKYWFEHHSPLSPPSLLMNTTTGNFTSESVTHPPETPVEDLVTSVLSNARKTILKALFPPR